MNISYKINNLNHRVVFCHDKESPDIKKDLSKLYSDKKMMVIIDKNLSQKFKKYLIDDLKQANFDITFVKVEASKKNKNEKFLFKIINKLIEKNYTKKSVIISCGGGVIGDVCALAASLYLRGLIYFHIPTTMTAIVDSCIGGKTGINYKNIINSLGNYYHPRTVFISKNVINLIPKREFLAGIPEIIKSGIIDNNIITKMLIDNKQRCLSRDFRFMSELIYLTLKTKIKFFKNDVYENSKRLNLNFGHTFAHAIEMSVKTKDKDIIRHGEAVGIGMLCEIYYSEGRSKKFKFLFNLLKQYNLPTNLRSFSKNYKKQIAKKEIFKNIFLDKKRIGKYPRIIKILKLGKSKVIEMKNNQQIKKTINNVIF